MSEKKPFRFGSTFAERKPLTESDGSGAPLPELPDDAYGPEAEPLPEVEQDEKQIHAEDVEDKAVRAPRRPAKKKA